MRKTESTNFLDKYKIMDEIKNEENTAMDVEQVETEKVEETSVAADAAEATEEETLEKQLSDANVEIADLKDKNLRMMAEFDNFRRRTAKEKLDIQKNAGERIFIDMLSLIDDFERAEQAMRKTDDIDAVKQGVELIHKKFITFLQDNDVKEIATEGESFNTDLHDAITTLSAGEENKGKIIDCTQKGYTLGDKVIRFAKVVVGE